MPSEHWTLEDFEHLDFGPCICGCKAWVVWNDAAQQWEPEEDAFRFYVVDPEYKTKGDTVVALVVERGADESP